MFVGSLILIAGLGVVVYALAVPSTALFFLGTMIVGFGWGSSFMGAFRMVSSLAPAGQRAEVIAYLGFSVPAVAAGLAATHLGLHTTMVLFSAIVAVLAAVAALAAAPWFEPAQATSTPRCPNGLSAETWRLA